MCASMHTSGCSAARELHCVDEMGMEWLIENVQHQLIMAVMAEICTTHLSRCATSLVVTFDTKGTCAAMALA